MSSKTVKPERPGGFLDFLTPDYLAREKMLKKIEKVFRSFGYDPIETPRVEFLRTLAGETSDTGKNIFHIRSTEGDDPLALPFDHTVPLARILSANPYDARKRTGIRLPWRRMALGPVFRAETPQKGRYRQFYQFDIDIAGTASMMADAEIVAVMYSTLKELEVDRFVIRMNNRKILNGLALLADIKDRGEVKADDISQEMLRILDKLDKIGQDSVLSELRAEPENSLQPLPALAAEAIERVTSFLNLQGNNEEKLSRAGELFKGIVVAEEGIGELQRIMEHLQAFEIPSSRIEIDFSIARGLDYYTGPVMEVRLLDAPEYGSVFSGGRYNSLVSRFTGRELPATGSSIGVDRLFAALDHLGVVNRTEQTVAKVMVLRLTKERDSDYLRILSRLRKTNLNAEICLLESTTFKAQFNFAINRGVKYVVICGENEFENGTVQVKNLNTRVQEEIPLDQLSRYFESL